MNSSWRNDGSRACPSNFLTFEGTATDSESPLQSTYIHAISLPPKKFTPTRQDANESIMARNSFYSRPWRNATRVCRSLVLNPSNSSYTTEVSVVCKFIFVNYFADTYLNVRFCDWKYLYRHDFILLNYTHVHFLRATGFKGDVPDSKFWHGEK